MRFYKLKSIIITSLALLLFLTPMFSLKVEAATVSGKWVPDHYIALFFSHMVYDGQQAVFVGQSPTGKMLNGTYSPKFNNSWKDLHAKGLYTKYTPASFGNAIGAGKYKMYAALSHPKTNFYGAIYREGTSNRYVVAFAGTDTSDSGDWLSDGQIGVGKYGGPVQIQQAEALVKKLPKNAQVVFTGHSLGGYIASTMALKTGNPAITFNAPGYVSFAMFGTLFSKNKKYIVNHEILKDPVSTFGYRPGKENFYGTLKDKGRFGSNYHTIKNFYGYALKQ